LSRVFFMPRCAFALLTTRYQTATSSLRLSFNSNV